MTFKICFVVTSPATALNFLRGYLSRLRSEGWNVTLICAPGEKLQEFARSEGVNVFELPMKRDPSLPSDLLALIRLAFFFLRFRPDSVVYATPKASFLAAVGSWAARVPVRIYEQWGLRLEGSVGARRRVLYIMEWLASRLSTTVIANSPSLKRRILELRVNGGTETVCLGAGSSHGVDVARFYPRVPVEQPDEATREFLSHRPGPIIGFVGRLHPDKGVDVLLEGFSLLARGIDGAGLLLVGRDEGALNGVGRNALEGQVHVVGPVSDPRPYYQEMDVIVLMSKREGFPNVILEAAAMGLPAVVSRSTGTVDSVIDESTGLIVDVGDSVALANSLARLLSSAKGLEEMGERARSRAVQQFSHAEVVASHVEYFREKMLASRQE